MTRLRHTPRGFLRALQVSRVPVAILVEGKHLDRYFYGKIAQLACDRHNVPHEIFLSQEVPGNKLGKPRLLAFYRYLRRSNNFVSDFKGKRTVIVLFLDKDIDDLLRRKVRSEHVIYTRYYDVENHILRESNFPESIAAATGLHQAAVAPHFPNAQMWSSQAANLWKDWLTICIVAALRKVRSDCTFSVNSRINNPLFGPVDPARRTAKIAEVQAASGCTNAEFTQLLNRVTALVERHYNAGRHDLFFRGKWYHTILCDEVRRRLGPRNIDQRFHASISAILAHSVNFNSAGLLHFRERAEVVVSKLFLP